jgi:hypothetical protein
MEGATQSLVKLSGIAADVRQRFGHILSLSENTRNYMGDMRQQIHQSGQSSGRVTDSVSDILEKTLGTQRAADRMDSATNDLRKLFDRLHQDTQRFKLSEDETGENAFGDLHDEEVVELRSTGSGRSSAGDQEIDLDLDDKPTLSPAHANMEQRAI